MTIQNSLKNTDISKLQDSSIADAIAQFKEATSSIYDAVGSLSNTTAAGAKVRLKEGKARAMELEEKAEEAIKSKPLVTVGIAFAAGWLVSYLLQHRSS